jgi:hypothetical protein
MVTKTITCECGQVEYEGTNYCLNCGRAIISIEKKKELSRSVKPRPIDNRRACGECGTQLRNGSCSICDKPVIKDKITIHNPTSEQTLLPFPTSGTAISMPIHVGDYITAGSFMSGSVSISPFDDADTSPIGYVTQRFTNKERILIETSKLLKRLAKDYPFLLEEDKEMVLTQMRDGRAIWLGNSDDVRLFHDGSIGGLVWVNGEEVGRVLSIQSTPQGISTKQPEMLLEKETKTDVSTAIDEITNGILEAVVQSLNSGMSYLTRMVGTIVSRIYRWSVSNVTVLRGRSLRRSNLSEDSKEGEQKDAGDINLENKRTTVRGFYPQPASLFIGETGELPANEKAQFTRKPKPSERPWRKIPLNKTTIYK